MKNITIRMDDEIHKALKLKTISDDITIQDKILNLIKEYVENNKKKI